MRDGHWGLEACRGLRSIEETPFPVYAVMFMWRGSEYEGLVPLLKVLAFGVQVFESVPSQLQGQVCLLFAPCWHPP